VIKMVRICVGHLSYYAVVFDDSFFVLVHCTHILRCGLHKYRRLSPT
jgi:hypothetical protein